MATDNRYSSRRQYRSVAFGTWKVGGARMSMEPPKLEQKTKSPEETPRSAYYNSNTIHGTPRKNSEELLTVKIRKLGESSPNLIRLHPTETVKSLGALPSSLTMPSHLGGDCYSSTEYVEYNERQCEDDDSCNGNTISEPIQAAFRTDRSKLPAHHLSSRRRNRLENSLQRVHQRSHSAGADASLGVVIPCSSDMRALNLSSARDAAGNSNAKFLRATKRFFKKIYSTATLPNKKPSLDADANLQKAPQFFEIGFRAPTITSDAEFSRLEDFHNYGQTYIDTSYPDSGLDMDRSSTPDQSMGSMTVTSSDSRVTSSDSSREDRCDDLFETLRREMHAMRARDAAILADLHRVESQIQSVKMARLGIYDSSPQPVPSLPI
ncbi:hypothetical protein RB195_020934 [Necator americanus]|uniref:Uncharacterized protein n=1 Tax=Necator americanus TaxID=51031 RepID=A0ABR1CL98_NECAM